MFRDELQRQRGQAPRMLGQELPESLDLLQVEAPRTLIEVVRTEVIRRKFCILREESSQSAFIEHTPRQDRDLILGTHRDQVVQRRGIENVEHRLH